MKIPIAIVDDNVQNRVTLAERINSSDEIEVRLTAISGEDFLDQMKKLPFHELPKVVLMDIEMPAMNGIEAVGFGKALYPDVQFLMLTVYDNDEKIFEAIKAGATGYLLKDEKVSKIIEWVQQVAEQEGAPMSPAIARKAIAMLAQGSDPVRANEKQPIPAPSVLSKRETEILRLLVEGYDYRATAEKLFLSSYTVRTHITNIYQKLHVTSKAKAINVAIKKNLI